MPSKSCLGEKCTTTLNLPPTATTLAQIGGIPFYDNSPVDNSDNKHQYFCPICMLYYSEVYKTRCCNNYMCQECSVMYVSGERYLQDFRASCGFRVCICRRSSFSLSHAFVSRAPKEGRGGDAGLAFSGLPEPEAFNYRQHRRLPLLPGAIEVSQV